MSRPLSGGDIKMKYGINFQKLLLQNVIKSLLQPKRFSVAENFQVTFSLGNKSLLWHDHVFLSCCYRQCVVWHTRYNVNVHYCEMLSSIEIIISGTYIDTDREDQRGSDQEARARRIPPRSQVRQWAITYLVQMHTLQGNAKGGRRSVLWSSSREMLF